MSSSSTAWAPPENSLLLFPGACGCPVRRAPRGQSQGGGRGSRISAGHLAAACRQAQASCSDRLSGIFLFSATLTPMDPQRRNPLQPEIHLDTGPAPPYLSDRCIIFPENSMLSWKTGRARCSSIQAMMPGIPRTGIHIAALCPPCGRSGAYGSQGTGGTAGETGKKRRMSLKTRPVKKFLRCRRGCT